MEEAISSLRHSMSKEGFPAGKDRGIFRPWQIILFFFWLEHQVCVMQLGDILYTRQFQP